MKRVSISLLVIISGGRGRYELPFGKGKRFLIVSQLGATVLGG